MSVRDKKFPLLVRDGGLYSLSRDFNFNRRVSESGLQERSPDGVRTGIRVKMV